mmetsp:Transcript_39764/g.68179  ORF Transcript_39764/g.68179 Transcript_39764/m.68179 type:complete len:397 (+) Transcript_39764:51-1241(+)
MDTEFQQLITQADGPSSSGAPKPFLVKLFKMVEDPATESIISWLPAGDGLVVHDVEQFVAQLLPQYFKHSNLSSFVRQLNTYGFSKVDPDAWVFAHPHFKKGDRESLHLIERKSSHRPHNAAAKAQGLPALDVVMGGADAVLASGDGAAGGASEEQMRRELAAIRSHHATMASRIQHLSQQVQSAREQQANTRGSINKIMSFLSQVYTANQSNLSNLPADLFRDPYGGPVDRLTSRATKRKRLEDFSSAEVAHISDSAQRGRVAADDSPRIGELDSVLGPAQLAGDEEPGSERFGLNAASRVKGSAAESSSGGSGEMPAPPAVERSISLGSQAALALDPDLQNIALELVSSTELQDEALAQLKRQASGQAGDGVEDLESFLWDFLETSQDVAEQRT